MYFVPTSLAEALVLRSSSDSLVLAGGTDICVRDDWRRLKPNILDITGLRELATVSRHEDTVRIGAMTRWAALRRLDVDGGGLLQRVAAVIGSQQIQNRATIGGNICNASPVADGLVALLALDATLELASAQAVRLVPIRTFLRDEGGTRLGPDELLTAIIVRGAKQRGAGFEKITLRRDMAISIIACATVVERQRDGAIANCRVVVGAASRVGLEMTRSAASVVASDGVLDEAALAADLGDLSPISDIRASAAYRRRAASVAVRRSLAAALALKV